MCCKHRVRLEKNYRTAGANFDTARHRLHQRIGISSQREYMALKRDADVACEKLDFARSELDSHISNHCCLTHAEGTIENELAATS
jgi:hypothetical protein